MAKKAFKQFAESHGLHVQSCNCDNDCFSDNAFIADCEQTNNTSSIVE